MIYKPEDFPAYFIIMKDSTIALHYFNPETDYALACGKKHYNPPKRVAMLKRDMQLFPATFASHGDCIVVDDTVPDASPYREEIEEKHLRIVALRELPHAISEIGQENLEMRPWGWNHSLLRTLLESGIPSSMLKTEDEIDSLRELSHRRTSVRMQLFLSTLLEGIDVPVATECIDIGSAMRFLDENGDAYFKMPWSSSGRGVVHAGDIGSVKLEEWISGAIRKQGSVLAEKAFVRSGDFATEWECRNGTSRFLGLSLFHTSPSGRYSGNVVESQEILWDRISRLSPYWNLDIIKAQKKALDDIIAPHYSGPAGIDMFATASGELNPLVEINLRQTMGMAAMLSYRYKMNLTAL